MVVIYLLRATLCQIPEVGTFFVISRIRARTAEEETTLLPAGGTTTEDGNTNIIMKRNKKTAHGQTSVKRH